MNSSALSAELADFMRDHVSSYEELHALLLLAGAPARAWSCAEMADSLKISMDLVTTALDGLLQVGGLVSSERQGAATVYRYAPTSDFARKQVADLQRAYAEDRMDVVQVMTANAMERVRGAAARRLADAFRFERSKK